MARCPCPQVPRGPHECRRHVLLLAPFELVALVLQQLLRLVNEGVGRCWRTLPRRAGGGPLRRGTRVRAPCARCRPWPVRTGHGDRHRLRVARRRSWAPTWTMPLASMSNGDLDLGHATGAGAGRPAGTCRASCCSWHLPLTLEHVDLDGGLVVLGRGGRLAPLGRDGGVALDQAVHDPALGSMPRLRGVTSSRRTSSLAFNTPPGRPHRWPRPRRGDALWAPCR